VVAFGLFGGIAFSASYQLVARFANKNVIALGLGCSASGPLVLLLQLALEMGPSPTRRQQVGRQQLAPASAAATFPERLHLPSLACRLAGGILWQATAPCSLPCASVYRLQVLLYEIIALIIAAGLWATISLLWRHWDSIEQHASKQVRPLAKDIGRLAAPACRSSFQTCKGPTLVWLGSCRTSQSLC
jgi:hypothetical protein